jgi:hypothetical protein
MKSPSLVQDTDSRGKRTGEFEAGLGYIVRGCLKKPRKGY